MTKLAVLRGCDDLSPPRAVLYAGFGRVLVEGQAGACAAVVLDVVREDPAAVPLAQDEHVRSKHSRRSEPMERSA